MSLYQELGVTLQQRAGEGDKGSLSSRARPPNTAHLDPRLPDEAFWHWIGECLLGTEICELAPGPRSLPTPWI